MLIFKTVCSFSYILVENMIWMWYNIFTKDVGSREIYMKDADHS